MLHDYDVLLNHGHLSVSGMGTGENQGRAGLSRPTAISKETPLGLRS